MRFVTTRRPDRHRLVYLIGFSGSGKSSVGRALAARLGWFFHDLDEDIVQDTGQDIPTIFRERGEVHFRMLEERAISRLCQREGVVVATGGGIGTQPRVREMMRQTGLVVALDAAPKTLYARLERQIQAEGEAARRPLLADAGPDELAAFHAQRQPTYGFADEYVDTDGLTVDEVAEKVHQFVMSQTPPGGNTSLREHRVVTVAAAERSYPVVCCAGALEHLPELLAEAGIEGAVHIVTDDNVRALYGDRLLGILRAGGCAADLLAIPPGEEHKNAATLGRVYDWLVERGAERTDAVMAFGGGVVGDLAGYAAATYLRGLPLVHVPTTLLAQVDSSIGGKVGLDHPLGKNLIGAFHQPALVVSDVTLLNTLPVRELAGGWAEVIKCAVILDAGLFDLLDREAEAIMGLDPALLELVVWRCIDWKAAVVEKDERERSRRAVLNFGHTVGHALEAVTGYGRFRHGEAVAVGMIAAGRIAEQQGRFPSAAQARLRALIERYGLPTRCDGIPAAAVLAAIARDKKARAGTVRWVLPKGIGMAEIGVVVPDEVVGEVLREMGADPTP